MKYKKKKLNARQKAVRRTAFGEFNKAAFKEIGGRECPNYGNVAAMKGGIEIPPRRTLLRALGRASRYDFVGACVWCRHGYRQFSLNIQAAHLKDCVEYQRAKAVLAQSGLLSR